MPTFTPIPPRLTVSKNIQVTHSSNINQARSESVVSINPWDSGNIIAASKRFRNLHTYDFIIEPVVSFDGGKSWNPAVLTLHRDWGVDPGMSDPTIVWDNLGWAYLFVGPHWKSNDPTDAVGNPAIGIGVWVYISKDGGKTWGTPVPISENRDDDKQWAASDLSNGSPHIGNVYVSWGAHTPLHFARSQHPGTQWRGPGSQSPGRSSLASEAFGPEISVGPDGTIYIFWHNDGSQTIEMVKSTNGGQTFFAPKKKPVVQGLTSIRGSAPQKGGWPHFPNGKFRVITLVTACVIDENTLIVAWSDYRDGVARIYYRRSLNGGENWEGADSGQPLLGPAVASSSSAHEFHPQIIAMRNGTVGCAFYEFGPRYDDYRMATGMGHVRHLIDVVMVASLDRGLSFSLRETVTERPWNPTTGAPWAHGDPNVHFIGEYFGFDADENDFRIVWTDTRTGMQELFTSKVYVQTSVSEFEPLVDSDTVFVPLHGSAGGVLINLKTGEIIPLPYPQWNAAFRTPQMNTTLRDTRMQQIGTLIEAFAMVENISNVGANAARENIMQSIQQIAAQSAEDRAEMPESQLQKKTPSTDVSRPTKKKR